MADVNFGVVQGVAPTTVPNTVSLTKTSFGTPGAAIVMSNIATVAGTEVDHVRGCFASMDFSAPGLGQVVGAFSADNAGANSNTYRYVDNDHALKLINGGGTAQTVADNGGTVTDGFDLDYTTNVSGNAEVVVASMFNGTDISNLRRGSINVTGLSQQNWDIGFVPDLVIFHNSSRPDSDSGQAEARLSIGAWVNDTDDPQRCHMFEMRDARSTAVNNSATYNNAAFGRIAGANTNFTATVTEYTGGTGGFSTTLSANVSNNIAYLAFKFTNSPLVELFDITMPTSAGNFTETGLAGEPSWTMMVIGQNTTINTIQGNDGFSIIMNDSAEQHCLAFSDEDDETTMDTSCQWTDGNMVQMNGSGTDLYDYAFSSFDSNGFTWTDTTASGTAWLGWGLAIGASAGGGGGPTGGKYGSLGLLGVGT